MKHFQKNKLIGFVIALALGSLVLVGCNSDTAGTIAGPEEPVSSNTLSAPVVAFGKGKNDGSSGGQQTTYPQYAEKVFSFNINSGYSGGNIQVPGGTSLSIANGSLIPPFGTPFGADVTITMQVAKKRYKGKDIMEFTFGPHGSLFILPAVITLDWVDLGINVANLYYIEDDGSMTPQMPDDIDIVNRKMKINVHHFSRYALSAD